MKILMEYKILNNGVKMPMIGLGVFRITDLNECEEVVYQAIKNGYRFIDTAAAYQNEEAVGKAIKRSGIDRKDLFISSKLWVTGASYEGAKRSFNDSLKRLGLDYLDLYVIHQPFGDYYGAWRALTELYQAGKIKAIGVDNFTQAQLADLIAFNEIKPAVNLLETHPMFQRNNEHQYLESEDITQIAWSPFAAGKFDIFKNDTLNAIGKKYNKSVAQVILRWLNQRGIVAVPKSSNVERMKQNINIFDFQLSDSDMNQIAKLNQNETLGGIRSTAKEVNEFLKVARTLDI